LNEIFEHFRNGITNRYPLCCIIAYCLGKTKGVVVRKNLYDVYRPCLLHQKKSISDHEHLTKLNNEICPLPLTDFDRFGYYK